MEQVLARNEAEIADRLDAGKQQLKASIKAGKPAPTVDVKSLALKEIHLRPAVFQHRSGNLAVSDQHIMGLTKALLINPTQALDPITVYWIGDRYVCIEGHHRMAAYKKTKYTPKIPVRVFRGSLEDAIGMANKDNSKSKLAYSKNERLTAAWRVIISSPSLTREKQREYAGVSLSTVKTMRRVANQLAKSHPDLSLGEVKWHQARDFAKGFKPKPDIGIDEYREAKTVQLAKLIRKHLGTRLTEDIDITVEALSRVHQELPFDIAEHMKDKASYDEDDGLLVALDIADYGIPDF